MIIGASSGIGRKLAEYYAGVGCRVAIAARRVELMKQIAAEFPNNIIYSKIDVSTSAQSIEHELNGLITRLGGLDLIIYSSGAGKQCQNISATEEIKTTKVNIDGFIAVISTAFNFFKDNGNNAFGTQICNYQPQIVTIASIAGIKGLGIAASYSASKRFQINYMEALDQLAHKLQLNITLSTIMPGFVDTDFIKKGKYPFVMSLDHASNHIINAIESKKKKAIINFKWRLIALIWKLSPSFLIKKFI